MARGFELIALAGLALGASHVLHYARRKRQRHEQREALHTWEAEGGAVPTSRTRTAAMQVTPATTAPALA